MFGNVRSNKPAVLALAAVVFLAAFVGLAFNHMEPWKGNEDDVNFDIPATPDAPKSPPHVTDSALIKAYIERMMKSTVKVDTRMYYPFGAFASEFSEDPYWRKPLGEKLCIIDLDSRTFDAPGQAFAKEGMSWSRPSEIHGLSTGVINHWAYAKIHGYKYYYIDIDGYDDRRDSWKKPTILAKILKKHDACIYLDSDAIFHHMDLPFEWLMNYWNLNPGTNSLALAADPSHKNNQDKFGKVYLNTGFIVAQNNDKTFEIFDEWDACAEDGGKHPDCVDFRNNRPGKPTDQGGFGTYIRYDYPKDIKELPCTEANGFPESHSGCEGKFIKHLWTGKKDWIKIAVGGQLPGDLLEEFQKDFLASKKDFYMTEKELMST
ncbi:hypothetical protein EDB81DRAFT_460530 [Dactylonectria macrodidyma]|uniref:Nucleotide-diphospho-sugar transferase domain-containing protein n=1 Tax=Dactylonectria macrodidyma TaxID=307937 RepID=A0A9P9EXQ8_9HYPO|nr:hypothetical protein EDB81DRAFT_460530 [Dactylonectria macrodidyma]